MAVDPIKAKQIADMLQAAKKQLAQKPKTNFQAQYNQGGGFKEQLEQIAKHFQDLENGEEPEVVEKPVEEVREIPTSPEVEKQVEGYIEKIEKEAELTKPVVDDYMQVLLGSATADKPEIKVPLADEKIQIGLHRQVWEAVRWLAEWCVRQIKKLGQKERSLKFEDKDWKRKILG